jgi:hypothetical protein
VLALVSSAGLASPHHSNPSALDSVETRRWVSYSSFDAGPLAQGMHSRRGRGFSATAGLAFKRRALLSYTDIHRPQFGAPCGFLQRGGL